MSDVFGKSNPFGRGLLDSFGSAGRLGDLASLRSALGVLSPSDSAKGMLHQFGLSTLGVRESRIDSLSLLVKNLASRHDELFGAVGAIRALSGRASLPPTAASIAASFSPSLGRAAKIHSDIRALTEGADLARSLGAASLRLGMLGIATATANRGESIWGQNNITSAVAGLRSASFGNIDLIAQMIRLAGRHSAASDLAGPIDELTLAAEEVVEGRADASDRVKSVAKAIWDQLATAAHSPLFELISLLLTFVAFMLPPDEDVAARQRAILRELRQLSHDQATGEAADRDRDRAIERELARLADQIAADPARVLATKARLHTQPKGSSEILMSLRPGDLVIQVVDRGEWAYVEVARESGVVFGWLPRKALRRPAAVK